MRAPILAPLAVEGVENNIRLDVRQFGDPAGILRINLNNVMAEPLQRGGYAGAIVGALILAVLTTLLTVLQMPEGAKRILFGLIVLAVSAAYLRIISER